MAKHIPMVERGETLEQAQEWQRSLYRYEQAGLCHVCAAQAAYGHQIGFSQVHPPCPECVPLVAAFPTVAVLPWRKMTRKDHSAARAARAAAKAAS